MTIQFQKKEEWFQFFDGSGKEINRKTEIRFDPLTKETSRVVFDPGLAVTPPDYTVEAKNTGGNNCPFCPENVLKLTPLLPKMIEESGRIAKDEALLFPNLFPYSKHNGVVILSKQHYVRLEEFTVERIKNALLVGQTYIERVMANDKDAKYASINWNYLPNSGGSILHPHMHIVVSEQPMNNQAQTIHFAIDFYKENNDDYFTSLAEIEKQLGERWIGAKGNIAWMHAFAPKSHNDFIAVFRDKTKVSRITEDDWTNFATSLKAIFATLNEQGFASFNMALNFISKEDNDIAIHARLIPRLTIGQLNTSDINFFQSLHNEPLSYKNPEEIAKLARQYFEKY